MAIVSSVKARLTLSFSTLVAIVLCLSALSAVQLEQANQAFARYVEGVNMREELAAELLLAAQQRAIHARNLVLVSDRSDRDAEYTAVSQAHNQVGTALNKLKTAISVGDGQRNQQERVLFDELARVESLYGPVALEIVALALDGHRDQAIQRMSDDCMPLLRQLISAAEAYMQHSRLVAVTEVDDGRALFESQLKLLVVVCLFSMALAIGLGVAIIRSLLRLMSFDRLPNKPTCSP